VNLVPNAARAPRRYCEDCSRHDGDDEPRTVLSRVSVRRHPSIMAQYSALHDAATPSQCGRCGAARSAVDEIIRRFHL
jgi:hypothetical protein